MYAKPPIHEIKYRFNMYVIIVKKKPSSIVTKNNWACNYIIRINFTFLEAY